MALRGIVSVIRNRDFACLWIGQIVSNLGDEVAMFGIFAIILYLWHGTSTDIMYFLIAISLPVLILGPVAGVFVDRWNRKKIMIAADIIRAALAFLLAFANTLLLMVVLIFGISVVSRFFYPARNAVIPTIVGNEELVEANSLSQMTYIIGTLLGPAIGTGMVMLFDYTSVFIFDAATYLFSALMISLMVYSGDAHKDKGSRTSGFSEFRKGLAYIRRHSGVKFITFFFAGVMIIFGGLNIAYSIYVRDALHLGIAGFAVLEILFGAGSIIGTLLAGIIAGRIRELVMVFAGLLGMGASLFVLGLFPALTVVYPAVIFAGGCAMMVNVPTNAILQRIVTDKYRGRVFGVIGAVMQAFTILSFMLFGVVLSIFDVVSTVFFLGVGLLVVSIFSLILVNKIERLVYASPENGVS